MLAAVRERERRRVGGALAGQRVMRRKIADKEFLAVSQNDLCVPPDTLVAGQAIAGAVHRQCEILRSAEVYVDRRARFTAVHDRRRDEPLFPDIYGKDHAATLRVRVGKNADHGGKRLCRAGQAHLDPGGGMEAQAVLELPIRNLHGPSRNRVAEHGAETRPSHQAGRSGRWRSQRAARLGWEMLSDPGVSLRQLFRCWPCGPRLVQTEIAFDEREQCEGNSMHGWHRNLHSQYPATITVFPVSPTSSMTSLFWLNPFHALPFTVTFWMGVCCG